MQFQVFHKIAAYSTDNDAQHYHVTQSRHYIMLHNLLRCVCYVCDVCVMCANVTVTTNIYI